MSTDASHDPHDMTALLEQYLQWLRVHNYAEHTIDLTHRSVAMFIPWAAERGLTKPKEITRPTLEQYQNDLYHRRQKNGKPLSARTQSGYLGPLRSWFRWMAKQNHLLYNPASEIELPHYGRSLPKQWFSVNEAEKVMSVADVETPLGLRDRAMLETLYSTGIRRMELIRLCLDDLDKERGILVVREGKGGKDRIVPCGTRALAWIMRYIHEVRPILVQGKPPTDVLFVTVKGGPLSPNTMSELMYNYVRAADLGKGGSCHVWRHTMATLMHEAGADIRHLQAILGHEDIGTTAIYTQMAATKLKEVHNDTHPAEQKPEQKPEP